MTPRRSRCWSRGIALVLLAAALLLPAAVAEEGAGLTDKERSKRRSALRNAGGRWITHRTRFPSRCPLCQGAGKIRTRKGRQIVRITCPQCDGLRAWLSRKDYRAAYYDMRSPAFQALPGIQDALGEQYRLASHGKPWPTRIDRYRLRAWELVDDEHGVVWYLYNASKSPTATYWVWHAEGRTKGRWCLYDGRADGPWPTDEDEDAPAGRGGRPGDGAGDAWGALTPEEGQALRGAVGAARITYRAYEFLRRGCTVRIRLKPWADPQGRPPVHRIGPDVVRLMRTVFRSTKGWDRVESEWYVRWRDAHERIRLRPVWIAALGRSAFEGADWSGATSEDLMRVMDWERVSHPGWSLLTEDARPVAAAPSVPEPAPTPEPAPAPEPVPMPEPPHPAPTPPPPPPTVRPPPESESFDLPELTGKARRAAEQGLAHMRALFQLAVTAHDEGVEARKNGAPDVWQEKLSEARTHLNDIEDAWLTDVVENMPGRDEGERDAVANEHFGEIWDEIYKLKAMVRKMSRLE